MSRQWRYFGGNLPFQSMPRCGMLDGKVEWGGIAMMVLSRGGVPPSGEEPNDGKNGFGAGDLAQPAVEPPF
jgi:hypothetical protein